jgi:hypothetical protein
MIEKSKAEPPPEQVARANRLRETIADIKRGARPEAKTPRDLTEQAAAEASRKAKLGRR